MGVVYRAYDPAPMDREVAVKTLHEFTDPLALELFYKECRALKSISHPNIVEIFDIGEFDDHGHKKPFFVMPLLQGQTLDALIQSASHRLTVDRVVDIISQTCRGLQAAHERGLIHRDLKPSNIFVMADDSVKIIDFGVAHAVGANTRSTGHEKGTLIYMSPEQLQHKPVSAQSDIYALGITAYEALTRRQPFRAATYEAAVQSILTQIPPPASELNPAVTHVISRAVHKAMAKQPWTRYDAAREFGDTLQKALRNEPISLFDPSRTQPRIQTATRALEKGDYQFAGEIVSELEAEGNIDPQITVLRAQIDQVGRQRTIAQLLDSARARSEEGEDPLALQKLQEVLQLDPGNVTALGLRSRIEERRHDHQIEKWMQLARQHVDNHSYGHAREALHNALLLRPKDTRPAKLLKDIEAEEQDYVRLRRQKTEIYQAAVNAWKNGEVSQALSQMKLVLELDRRAPDTSSPDAAGAYQNFFDKIRSEHEAISNSYAEARRHLAEKDFSSALRICREFLERYPGHALFQALKFDIEEQQRQQLSGFIAEVDRRLDAERDLDAKVNLLREAVGRNPEEVHFARLLALFENKRDLVNSIVERARVREESGLIHEALGDLDTLQTIYSSYPGLDFERQRLQKRLEQHTRESAKAHWVRQIDRQLDDGSYALAIELLERARAEFPADEDLVELQKLAEQGLERAAEAERLGAEGQTLCAAGDFEGGIDRLHRSRQLEDRPATRLNVCDALVAWGHARLAAAEWQAGETLADQALEIEPAHTPARHLRTQAQDQKREQIVGEHASAARRLQGSGEIDAALAEVQQGLARYPSDARLQAILDALLKEAERRRGRSDDLTRSSAVPMELTVASTAMPTVAVAAPTPTVPAVTVPRAATVPRSSSGKPGRNAAVLVGAAACVVAAASVGYLLWPQQPLSESVSIAPPSVETAPAVAPPPIDAPGPPATVAGTNGTLTIRQMPPGTTVSVDNKVLGTIGANGALSLAGIAAGRRAIQFGRDSYESVTVARDFGSTAPVVISGSDITFRAASITVEFLADATTEVVVSQGDQPLHRFTGPAKLPLAEGSYQVVARGSSGLSTTETALVSTTGSRTIDLRNIASGMEQFERAGWTEADTWFSRRGGGFVLYSRTASRSRISFTVRPDRSRNPFSSGPRFKWLVGYVDARNHALVELSDEYLYRTEVVNGMRRELPRIAHRIPQNGEFLHISVDVSNTQIVHQFNAGTGWQVLDTWARPTPADARFGFYLPGSESLAVSNFRYDPVPSQ